MNSYVTRGCPTRNCPGVFRPPISPPPTPKLSLITMRLVPCPRLIKTVSRIVWYKYIAVLNRMLVRCKTTHLKPVNWTGVTSKQVFRSRTQRIARFRNRNHNLTIMNAQRCPLSHAPSHNLIKQSSKCVPHKSITQNGSSIFLTYAHEVTHVDQ